MVVQDVLVCLVKLADDVEDTLGNLGDEGPHDSAVPEIKDIQTSSGRGVDPVTSVLGAVATPLGNRSNHKMY